MEVRIKRQAFREVEKAKVRQLVLERKDIVESKKSDMNSLIRKKNAWEEIGNIFNSTGLYPYRSTAQIKKMWENQKAKRKAQLALEKRDVKTERDSQSVVFDGDPELESLGEDVKPRDAIDSDSLHEGSAPYKLGDSELLPTAQQIGSAQTDEDESPIPLEFYTPAVVLEEELVTDVLQQGVPPDKGTQSTIRGEIESRIQRNDELRDGELHQLRKKELQQKIALLDQERLLIETKLKHETEIFELKRSHEIELFELEKRKKLMKIRKFMYMNRRD